MFSSFSALPALCLIPSCPLSHSESQQFSFSYFTPISLAQPEKVTVTEASGEESDDDMPQLEAAPAPAAEAGAEHKDEKPKVSRSEKKSRKAMAKLGLKPVPGIVSVHVKKSKNVRLKEFHPCLVHQFRKVSLISNVCSEQILFVISQPEVYKSPTSDTYVLFGEAKIEDLSAQSLAETAKQFEKQEAAPAEGEKKAEAKAEEPEGEVYFSFSL